MKMKRNHVLSNLSKALKKLIVYIVAGLIGTVLGWYIQILIEEVFK